MGITRILLSFLGILCFCGIVRAQADKPDAETAMNTVSGKVVWHMSISVPLSDIIAYLRAIRQTYDDLRREGTEPDMVIVLSSISQDEITRARIKEAQYAQIVRTEVNALIIDLQKQSGIRMEADARSIELFDDNTRAGVAVVDNIYLSLINHQNQGYSLIPIYAIPTRR